MFRWNLWCFRLLRRSFFVFTGFFGDVILKAGLMFPQDGRLLNPWFNARPLAARHADQDPSRGIPCPCRYHLTKQKMQRLIEIASTRRGRDDGGLDEQYKGGAFVRRWLPLWILYRHILRDNFPIIPKTLEPLNPWHIQPYMIWLFRGQSQRGKGMFLNSDCSGENVNDWTDCLAWSRIMCNERWCRVFTL